MKKISLIISLLFLSLFTFAQAEMTFETTEHDFGSIAYDGDGSYVFKYTNTGNQPLIILDVESTCGCTTPVYTKEPLKPGATGLITVEYDTSREGKFDKSVIITSTAKNSPVTLNITGEVELMQASDGAKSLK